MTVHCPDGLRPLQTPIDQIRPNPRNPRIKHDVKAISAALEEFGWHSALVALPDGELLIGHGRLAAARKLGLEEVPVIRVDDDEPQALARMVSDNRLGELSEWDFAELELLIEEIHIDDYVSGLDIDGLLDQIPLVDVEEPEKEYEEVYTKKVEAPIYRPTGDNPPVNSLYDDSKTSKLSDAVAAAGLPKDIETFLLMAACRHTIFDYKKIAEFYAHAPKEIQRLMEDSALVIIDFNRAIELGYVKLADDIADQYNKDYPDEA
jgi:hypothetical protein